MAGDRHGYVFCSSVFLNLACWWKKCSISPSLRYRILERSRAMVRLRDANPTQWSLSFLRSHSSYSVRSLESISISKRWRISFAISSLIFIFPTFLCPHFCSPLLSRCSFRENRSTAQIDYTGASQFCLKASIKPGTFVQKLSKWKRHLLLVATFKPRMSGQWSDTPAVVLYRTDSGKMPSHSRQQKARSKQTSVGDLLSLDHVYLRPSKGILWSRCHPKPA